MYFQEILVAVRQMLGRKKKILGANILSTLFQVSQAKFSVDIEHVIMLENLKRFFE